MSNFIHLHTHNEFSLLDGVGTSDQVAEKVKNLNQSSIATTNHGNVDGVWKFKRACNQLGIKPIYGFEGYIVPDHTTKEKGEKRDHIIILAKNETGWTNICKMLTIANLKGFYYRPRIDPEILKQHSEGLIISTACSSSFIFSDYGEDLIKWLLDNNIDIFGEIMPFNFNMQIKTNLKVLELSKKYNLKLIATNDCHYVNEEDNVVQEVLLAMQRKQKWKDPNRWKFDVTDLYMKSYDEMMESFKKQNCLDESIYKTALLNTKLVEEMCAFKLENKKVNLPSVPGFENINEEEKLKELCTIGLNKKIKGDKKEYRARLRFELDTIINLGFTRYFLIVWELVNWCKNNDILVGAGRGSAGGSLVCYLLNITEVDPIHYGLLFGRFISPARIDLPDIDMDFEDRKRYKIREHFEEIYGKENVAGVSTLSTMKGKGAIRDVSRVFDIPLVEVNKACDCIVVRSGGDARADFTIGDAFSTFEDGKRFAAKYPKVVDIAMKLEGQIKTKGMHAAAIVINDKPLTEGNKCVLQYGKDKNVMITYDKHDLDDCGLMKLDVLGLNALTVLAECRDLIKLKYNVNIDYNNIPLDDEECFKQFSEGNNIGCFQVGSLGLRRFCRQLGIDDFMMLVHASSLYRPGTLRSGITTKFVQRKRGEKKIPEIHPMIWNITKDTYGVILYQEQVMMFMYDLAGLGWRTADTVRKVISKSQGVDVFNKFKKDFADGCEKKGTLKREEAEILWSELASFGCLTGDTIIYRCSSNQYTNRELTIEEAFKYQNNRNFKHRKLKILSMHDDNYVKYNTINKIIYTGHKNIYGIKTKTGKYIKATDQHIFLIDGEWQEIKEAVIGSLIKVTDLKLYKKNYKSTNTGSGGHNHDGSLYTIEEKKQINKLKNKYNNKCQDCGSNKNIEMHHMNGNHRDNSDENTRLLCRKCHHNIPYHKPEEFIRFKQGYYTYDDIIIEIKYLGKEHVYDIEMVEEPRNFIANEFVSHNSYGFNKSHAVEYTLISYWDMWLKVHYPLEFICASLTHGSEQKKEYFIEEAFRLNLNVKPPKVGISKAFNFIIENNCLYMPFIEIKGFGEKTAQYAEEYKIENEGFIDKKQKLTQRFVNILKEINSFKDEELTDDEAERIQNYFKYSLIKDKSRKIRNLYNLLSENIQFSKIINIDFNTSDREDKFYYGAMTEIKFGYRGKIDTLEKQLGYSGTKDNLGGVYGNFVGDTDFCMLVFNAGIYHEKKEYVEHSSGKILIAKANRPNRNNAIMCKDAWFEDELLKCELNGLEVKLAKKRRYLNKEIENCTTCKLREECSKPVLNSTGLYNIMIIGEAPGRDEDIQSKGFVGRSGQLVWDELNKYNLKRNMFNVSNVVKCYPSKNKTPTKIHIKHCSKWLNEEIEKIKPSMILAFGNTNLKFFTEEDSGIMNKNGTTEWNYKYNTWISWCIHPASVLYSPENRKLFEKGIKNFAEKINNFFIN